MNMVIALPASPHCVVGSERVTYRQPCLPPECPREGGVWAVFHPLSYFLNLRKISVCCQMGVERAGKQSIGLSHFPRRETAMAVAGVRLLDSALWINTLTGSSIRSYGEAVRAGTVVCPHGIVADMGAGRPCGTFIFIWKKQKGPISMYTPYFLLLRGY